MPPTVFNKDGFRFFFYSNEHKPIHIHVEKGDSAAKFDLEPVSLVKNEGMRSKELKKAEEIIIAHREEILIRWREYFV